LPSGYAPGHEHDEIGPDVRQSARGALAGQASNKPGYCRADRTAHHDAEGRMEGSRAREALT